MDGDEKKSLSNAKRVYATFNGVSVGLNDGKSDGSNGNTSHGLNDSIKSGKNNYSNGDITDGKNDSVKELEKGKSETLQRQKGISTNAAMFHFMKGNRSR